MISYIDQAATDDQTSLDYQVDHDATLDTEDQEVFQDAFGLDQNHFEHDQLITSITDMRPNSLEDIGVIVDQSLLVDQEIPQPIDAFQAPADPWESLRLTEILLKSSHNSYEGDQRGSIVMQLNQGVRGLEYDIHDNDFQNESYRVGHYREGDGVDHSRGNPSGNRLDAWLEIISQWSENHSEHAPIILTIDLKDNLMDNRSFNEGNLSHLNHILQTQLSTLYPAHLYEDDTTVADLKGQVLCVLSGDQGTRLGYLYDVGYEPTISVNQDRVVELHHSGSGHLWYWSGRLVRAHQGHSMIRWQRHGRYDTGTQPTLLVNAQGRLIEIHKSENYSHLWYNLGHINANGDVIFNGAQRFETDGQYPSIQWETLNQDERIIVRYQSLQGQLRQRSASIDWEQNRVDWDDEILAEGPAFNNQVSTQDHQRIFVDTHHQQNGGASGRFPSQAITYRLLEQNQEIDRGYVRYENLCFVEWQNSEHTHQLLGVQPFGAVSNAGQSILNTLDDPNRSMVRIWSFATPSNNRETLSHLPASDQPLSTQYQNYCQQDERWIE